ncbi:response regulator [Bacteroidales bacterium OttesenSCG-928-J19]|nr:response regulator [Bacteroidales bacterium OttesenSCG-928-J19]
MNRIIRYLFLSCCIIPSLVANPSLIVEHFSEKNGLPTNAVNVSIKGSDGFLWFGTWHGLSSFDGQKFRHYHSWDGVSPNIPPRKIQDIVEDKNGFLWIKTNDNKLFIFDKIQEKYYLGHDEIKDYSSNTQIIRMKNTPDQEVLLLTKTKNLLCAFMEENGETIIRPLYDSSADINLFNSKLKYNILTETADYIAWIGMNNQFFYYPKSETLKEKAENFITRQLPLVGMKQFTCARDREDQILLGDKQGYLYLIDLTSGVVRKHKPTDGNGSILDLFPGSSGKVYLVIEKQGVYEYDPETKRSEKLFLPIDTELIGDIVEDQKQGLIFHEKPNAVIFYDPVTKTNRRFSSPAKTSLEPFQYEEVEDLVFLRLPSGEVWIYDREKETFSNINRMKEFSDISETIHFYNLMLDDNRILWLSSSSSGVFRILSPQKQFRLQETTDFSEQNTPIEKSQKGVKGIFQSQNGDIWIGSRWGSLYKTDPEGQIEQEFSEKTGSYIGRVYHILEDDSGTLWFSTKGNGLVKAVPDANSQLGFRISHYASSQDIIESLSYSDVYYAYQDSRGRIWVGTHGGGVNLLWEENGQVTFKHKYNGFKQYPQHGMYMEVRNIIEDNQGRIWVGTTDGLLSFPVDFDQPEDIRFETYRGSELCSSMANNDIPVLFQDSKGDIWVSVFGGGLNKLEGYDEEKQCPILKTYGVNEGLSTDIILSIVEDDRNRLWLAGENGLSCFNKETGLFRNYDRYDGFPDISIEGNSALKTRSGEIWLGGTEGLLKFNPDEVETTKFESKTYIVDFRISNRDIRSFTDKPIIDRSIKYIDEITLRHDQSMFAIEFATLNFYNQNRFFYKYILEGYEKEWHHTGNNRVASYTNIPPGDYTFRVQSIDGANPEYISEKSLSITVLPPWWMTWWAKCIYLLFGLALLIGLIRFSAVMVRMKNDVYIQQKLSELKIKFFTNISHELRTPLTLIKGPIQELKGSENLSEKEVQYVELMEKNTEQMLNLVNQILDFRKIQNEKMRLHVSLLNLNELLNTFRKEFQNLAEEKKINYTVLLTDEPVMLWADRERLEIVLRNILSNAFKFTPEGGYIFVSSDLSPDGKECHVRVEDSGIGFAHNDTQKLFERFSQGENTQTGYYTGTGIGLALSREIMLLHHGNIEAESNVDKGAVFTLVLQTGKDHFSTEEVDFYFSDNDSPDTVGLDDKPMEEEEKKTHNENLPSVLLVEDNLDLCNLIKMQLEDRFNVYIANNGLEGLKKVHLYYPDIIVADQMMPEMDGLEMLREIRKDFNISHIPVIILTAKQDEKAKTEAINIGASAYITKPFSKDYLEAYLEQLLRERKLFRERLRSSREETEKNESYNQFLMKKDVQFMDDIYRIIEENMENLHFNIDTIASTLGLSRSAFFKKLKSLTGFAPIDLVKEVRLNKSVELIKTTDMSISEIAYAVGFKDSGYFGKCFRKKFDKTPREFMNEWRKQ